MKKSLLTLAILAITGSAVFAQGKKLTPAPDNKKPAPITVAPAPQATNQTENTMKFKEEKHDFGTVQEGDPAVYEFTFTNTGKEPILIQNAKGSCGCTVPSYSKDAVPPGKTGTIKVSYNTKGRPGPINKTVTVQSNVGTTVLHIGGNVEKAPATSVPENKSMMKSAN